MKCIACGAHKWRTLETRAHEKHVRRRKECLCCRTRISTVELPVKLRQKAKGIQDTLANAPAPAKKRTKVVKNTLATIMSELAATINSKK